MARKALERLHMRGSSPRCRTNEAEIPNPLRACARLLSQVSDSGSNGDTGSNSESESDSDSDSDNEYQTPRPKQNKFF
ncbi:hypothetical protein M430DRAFT_36773 [Amorphotheca resinae ATCC 22711]|uniref:Uncharacterized protein n=1 Tax=Amorphotheca resinae ATCC 22711 TaxID=857342 RepID=A0A2T3AVP0_AMORE|nr:hypothetical protein M430DRAFT_36773 [Amorphotheca resinae ATCC 22711]PSS12728.1 hypothetical protein M430DRAFT_36773 [Amorphotheca resinae ATCC 22711]